MRIPETQGQIRMIAERCFHSSMQHSLSLRRNQTTSFGVKLNSRIVEHDGAPGDHLPSDSW